MSAMLQSAIDYAYDTTGEVLCRNAKGLTFFLYSEPFSPKPTAAATPASPAPAWKQVEATVEVAVRRVAEPQSITEMTRVVPQTNSNFTAVEATREVEVRRATAAAAPAPVTPAPAATAARGTGPLPEVPEPGQQPQKGWFNKLFTRA